MPSLCETLGLISSTVLEQNRTLKASKHAKSPKKKSRDQAEKKIKVKRNISHKNVLRMNK